MGANTGEEKMIINTKNGERLGRGGGLLMKYYYCKLKHCAFA